MSSYAPDKAAALWYHSPAWLCLLLFRGVAERLGLLSLLWAIAGATGPIWDSRWALRSILVCTAVHPISLLGNSRSADGFMGKMLLGLL